MIFKIQNYFCFTVFMLMCDMIILDDLCQLGAECLFIEILLMIGKTVVVKMSFPDHLAGVYSSLSVR